MADHQPECIVCSAKHKTPFHKITYEKTPGKPDEPSLAERLSKILKVDDIYSAYHNRVYSYPLQLCAECLAQLTAIESARKVKKNFRRSFKKVLCQAQVIPSTCGAVGEGSISAKDKKRLGQRLSSKDSKKKKERKSECELSVGDLELCIREIDELITQTLQDELVHKGKSSIEKTDEPELLSTELAIVKEMFCEMEKEVGKIESPTELSGSAKPGGVIHELLMKQRITSDYKGKLVQHLKRMISYISKGASKFECKGDGLQKFCDILEIVFSQDPKEKDSERGDIADDNTDNLSVSSSHSSMSSSSISFNLKQSVQDIFKQTASQIAEAWQERRRSVKTTKGQVLESKRQSDDKEEQQGNEQVDKELVIGAQVQKIINGEEEDEQEIIDIESLGSEETNEEEEESDDKAREPEEGGTEESAEDKEEEEKVGDGSVGQSSSSDKDGPMVIDSEDDKLDQDTTSKGEVKTEPKVSQDDIQEIKLTEKDVPVICIDSDDDNDDKSNKESSKDSVVANDPSDISNMPSFEESRWKYQQEKQGEPRGQGSEDCFIVTPVSSGNVEQPNWPGCTGNSGKTMPASGGKGVFSHKRKFSSAAGVVFGNMVGGGQHKQVKGQQPRYGNHFLIKRRTNIWTNGKGNQRQFEPYIGGISQRFKFNKKKYKQKPHFNQQGNASATGNNKNNMGPSQKFQFKHKHGKKHLQNSPANAESLPSNIGSPTSGSKLDIIPVIPSREKNKQVPTGSKTGQGSQWTPGTNPPGAVTVKQQKSQHHKLKLKKKHQGKQQHNKKHHHYNPGSKQVVTKQRHNHGNPHYRTSGGMFQPGRSSFQKTSQPPVMQVLGCSSSQTLKVKASW